MMAQSKSTADPYVSSRLLIMYDVFFCVELLTRMAAWGRMFFTLRWNNFDMFIVAFTTVPLVLQSTMQNNFNGLGVLRTLRVARAARTVKIVLPLRVLVHAMLNC